jgi:hypothetical protein
MDNSFLKLSTDFTTAKLNENLLVSQVFENRFIQMLPNETFLQITNSNTDIAFAGNLEATLVNCAQETKFTFNVNDNFYLNEFTDIKGIRQIAFEFGNIGIDFGGELLYLKLQHTTSDKVWYSAPFVVTKINQYETTRFDYKNQSYFRGISYENQNFFQSIRLVCYDNDLDYKIEEQGYTEQNGDVVSFRQILSNIRKGTFKYCNNFIFERVITLFSHDILYVNGFRTNNKPAPKKGDRIAQSNFFQLDYEYNLGEEFKAFSYQIYQYLEVVNRIFPQSSNLYLNQLNGLFKLTFNKNIAIETGTIVELYKNSVLVASVTPLATNNVLDIDFLAYSFTAGNYDIIVKQNEIFSSQTAIPEYFKGFTFGEWQFNLFTNAALNLTNITRVVSGFNENFTFIFNKDFPITELYYQFKESADLPFIGDELFLGGTSSPQLVTLPLSPKVSFRIYAVNTSSGLTVFSNEFIF